MTTKKQNKFADRHIFDHKTIDITSLSTLKKTPLAIEEKKSQKSKSCNRDKHHTEKEEIKEEEQYPNQD